ncbi:hypothetical protein [uncultured Nostoc sp.]|uniref:hypothetical protein n=1 Tax=uncultured Nostoc sp. TaxID=340711 RepID=UPI0035C9FC7B
MTANFYFIKITSTTGIIHHLQISQITEFYMDINEIHYIKVLGRENSISIDKEEFDIFYQKMKKYVIKDVT